MTTSTISNPLKIAIITGSTRPGRKAGVIAEWVRIFADKREDLLVEIVDLAEENLPIFDEPLPPMMGQYANDYSREWAAKIGAFDAFVFVTPEYNRSIPGVLKNAIDFVFAEWNDKAAGFVSYSADGGGIRAAEQLRLILGELKVAVVRSNAALSLYDDFENFTNFVPRSLHGDRVETMLTELTRWGVALRDMREGHAA